ncbi:DUF790 family protein [Halorarum halophilum]|uniref:DUF790 family protein n=1 Tax=Halorarum halophilum TaxID=2743090 RepID=A0A7D5GGR7_9EURY|nr:DUF790 family protein [Halobaculum halophilum]QLG26991.1 DUF790 family protein [Halobaculum halophilum]
MLRKDLLRVSRRGGGYRPEFVAGDADARALAARALGTFQGHVGEPRRALETALEDLEREAPDFKLVRGFASLLEREATFETRAPLPPERARRAAFDAAERVGVSSEDERARALADAADGLGTDPDAVDASLYADREPNRVLVEFDTRWTPDTLCEQYDLSLAQTALFDATEVRIRSADPKALVSAAKRLGLLYEVVKTDGGGRELIVTGPDALFRRSRRYGTAFARLLRTVAGSTTDWELTATIDDRGTERELRLTDADVSVPGVEPLAEPAFDSGVEADFAARFRALDLDWDLVREPEPLETGYRVMIPDFAFEYDHADFRVFFEVMGFWTPEYVEKKLGQLAGVEDVELVVAVDESLGAGEAVEARDHRAIPYSGTVRVKDVVDALREYESELEAEVTAGLPAEFVPDADVVTLEAVAADHAVPIEALDHVAFPEHGRVGGALVRPAVLSVVGDELEPGMTYADAESVLAEHGISDASAALSELGYRVAWEGLGGGTLREKD